jgi:type IV secretory pathway VirB2 component (pilin)
MTLTTRKTIATIVILSIIVIGCLYLIGQGGLDRAGFFLLLVGPAMAAWFGFLLVGLGLVWLITRALRNRP